MHLESFNLNNILAVTSFQSFNLIIDHLFVENFNKLFIYREDPENQEHFYQADKKYTELLSVSTSLGRWNIQSS